ncbi:MAG: hypothetical protein WBO24_09870, partial [Nitrospirales bacterium]
MTVEMTEEEKRVEVAQKVLGAPVIFEVDSQTLKIKTNIMFISVIAITISFFNLGIQEHSTLFGLAITNLNIGVVKSVFSIILFYLLFHFIWLSWDNLLEWRLRVTGTKSVFETVGKYKNPLGDYPKDSRQSSLYNWWVNEAHNLEPISKQAKVSLESLQNYQQQ